MNFGLKTENRAGTKIMAPSILITINKESKILISAWNLRLEKKYQKMIPPTKVVAVKLTAFPVVFTAK
jgi:hypothetical protein